MQLLKTLNFSASLAPANRLLHTESHKEWLNHRELQGAKEHLGWRAWLTLDLSQKADK